ncbi:MAG: hypothetical protein HOO96_12015 [Polyangiaceae bacterium]|nr:hypothetical protein [Polyangiaceae bacterium]
MHATRFARVGLALAVLPAFGLAHCAPAADDPPAFVGAASSGGSSEPAPASYVPVDDELRAFGVEDDELVLDDLSEEESDALPEIADEGTMSTPDDDILQFEDDASASGIGTASAGLRLLGGGAPEKDACGKTMKQQCKDHNALNCKLPNPRPGKNRVVPDSAVERLCKTSHAAQLIDEVSVFPLVKKDSDPAVPFYDGTGTLRLRIPQQNVPQQNVRINYGMRRNETWGGVGPFVYAFKVAFDGSGGGGWIPQANVDSPEVRAMPTLDLQKFTLPPSKHQYRFKTMEDYGCVDGKKGDVVVTRANMAKVCIGDPAEYKVRPRTTSKNDKLGDYLVRFDAINLCWSTPTYGGVALDTFLVEPSRMSGAPHDLAHVLRFQRAVVKDKEKRLAAIAHIQLYEGGESKVDASGKALPRKRLGKKATFFFGSVNGRNGWIAKDALVMMN